MMGSAIPCGVLIHLRRNLQWWSRLGVIAWVLTGFAVLAGDYAPGTPVGQVTQSGLAEISGIAASRQNPGVLWIHNDRARDQVFAIRTDGRLLGTWTLGGEVDDFEDIAVGPGPRRDLQYLYCGDIGDNSASRSSLRVYRAAEPAVDATATKSLSSTEFPLVEVFQLTYPDGAHNAETLMVDPWTGDVLIATKERAISRIYRAEPSQLIHGAKAKMPFVTEIPFDIASAGDISADGREILIRQEEFARIWRRRSGQTVAEALAGVPTEVPVIGTPLEPNGEAVTFAPDGSGYLTISEGTAPRLYFFAKTNGVQQATTLTLVRMASAWRYLDDGSDPGPTWSAPEFDDTGWKVGAGQFGYGEDDERTVISYGTNKDHKHVTTYFRHGFTVTDASRFTSLRIRAVYDDGLAAYLNGSELFRSNLPSRAGSSDPALTSASSEENLWKAFVVPNFLNEGTNHLAVEVHRFSRSEGDLSFELQLLGETLDPHPRFSGVPIFAAGVGWVLHLESAAGDEVQIEHSLDLRAWAVLGRLALTNGTGTFPAGPDPAAARFFRLRGTTEDGSASSR